jgi:hypothetical protein
MLALATGNSVSRDHWQNLKVLKRRIERLIQLARESVEEDEVETDAVGLVSMSFTALVPKASTLKVKAQIIYL